MFEQIKFLNFLLQTRIVTNPSQTNDVDPFKSCSADSFYHFLHVCVGRVRGAHIEYTASSQFIAVEQFEPKMLPKSCAVGEQSFAVRQKGLGYEQ